MSDLRLDGRERACVGCWDDNDEEFALDMSEDSCVLKAREDEEAASFLEVSAFGFFVP